ncbi:GvpL/GvpF family gas vesicle protein [Thermopolyspora sp. NPDC052614]|uniref:GvpL/GvpF family gas vesicle protein n=1 Tax=Thermopolyspora sp. NPDC052614 TaxID=3155682 RepID=UPI003412E934
MSTPKTIEERRTPAGESPQSPQTPHDNIYLYGIVPSDVEVAENTHGVGEPGVVTLIRHGDVAALVSDLHLVRPLGRPEDLLAHERLLDATAAEVPVLPIRFGAVLTGPEAVSDLLAAHHDEFARALGELEGRVQYVVKGRYVEQAVLREVLDEHPEIAELREQIEGRPEAVTRQTRIQIGEIVGRAIEARREADTQALAAALAPVCVLISPREPTHDQDAAHLAVLVDAARTGELEEILDGFAEHWTDRVRLRLLGPMASYDFVLGPGAGEG